MQTLKKQQGMSFLGILTIGIMVGFFVMSAIRIAPGLIEYRLVRDIVIEVVEDFDNEEDTITDMRRSFESTFNTNQIKTLDPRDIDVSRKDGRVFVDANYEDRIPLFWRLDIVVKYDDLVFEAGERYRD